MMRPPHPDPARLSVVYVDGRSGHAQLVSIWVEPNMLQMAGQGLLRQIPLNQIEWSQGGAQGERIAGLPGGSALHVDDKQAWFEWQQHENLPSTQARHAERGWRWSLLAALLLLAICASTYVFALPRNQG